MGVALQSERALRQKLDIQSDGLKHQNTVLKEELRDQVQKLEEQLAEASSLLELEQAAHRKAEEKAEELRASVRHLSLKSDGLEDKSHDIHDRLKVAESQRDRLDLEVEQLEAKLSAADKELMTKLRAADDEITKLRDQIQVTGPVRFLSAWCGDQQGYLRMAGVDAYVGKRPPGIHDSG